MTGRIDTHHHMFPSAYLAQRRDAILATAPGLEQAILDWTPALSLDGMDRAGIDAAVLSLSTPGIWFGDRAETAMFAQLCNEYGAGLVQRHPDRFGFFAALPLPDVDASLAAIDHAFDDCHADGVSIMSSYGPLWPGDPAMAPVFDALNDREAVVFVHPMAPAGSGSFLPILPPAILEFPFDTVWAIASLLYEGTFSRCPRVRFVFSHGGGAIAALAARLTRLATRRADLAARLPNGAMHELQRLFFDVVSVGDHRSFDAPCDLVGANHLVFGTDVPYWDTAVGVRELAGLALPAPTLAAIEHGTASGLFPALVSRMAVARR